MAALTASLLLLLLTIVPTGCARSLVAVNSGVQVARGRMIYVTKSELSFVTDVDADCKVEVVLNEPVTQRVGKLSPQVFDCNFLEDEVKYIHNGSPLLDEDTVMLRVYSFRSVDTQVEVVIFKIQVVDVQSGVVTLGSTPLVVPQFLGLSNAINSSMLTIKAAADRICTVRLMTSDTGVPSAGQLVREDNAPHRKGRQVALCPGNKPCLHDTEGIRHLKTGCQDFLSLGLKYQHLSPPTPQIDYVSIRVELREQATRVLLESEAVWLPVLILGAMQNQPPKAGFMASFILEVDQFILTPFTTAALDAEDHESPKEKLVFNVTVPPGEGYITHLDDHTRPIQSFSWLDLHHLKIAYQPPNSSSPHRRDFEVEFQAIDTSFLPSPPMLVHISIRPSETIAPRVSWNLGLDLLEGQSRPITWEELQIVDSDNIDAVFLVAVDGPQHGRLSVRGGKAFMFQVRDLKEGVVVYHHSDSDTTHDHIVFRISDGRRSIRHKFPINILPKDDSPPFLINNVAVEVQEGGAVRLEEFMLLASDLDSSDDHILYHIISPPRAGQLIRRTSTLENAVPVDHFLQRDLTQGRIFYQHSGEETFQDFFDFTLADSHQPPHLSQTYTMVIYIFPVKDQLPVEVSGTIRSLTVKETEVVFITQAHLHFTDSEDPGADLTFIITQPCFSPARPEMMDAGRLIYSDSTNNMKKDHMVPGLKSFTQHAVDHMKVAFIPPMEDIGNQPLFVQFAFSVVNQHGGTISGLTFNITINPVDNQKPEAFTNILQVEEGGATFVTEEQLLVHDPDSREEALRVEVQNTALHGRLELQGRVLLQGEGFSLQDLRGLRLRYVHDDSESTEDEVGLKVTDGVNFAEVVLHIQVLPINDEPPQLGRGLNRDLTCREGGRIQLTVDYLSATDRDSEDSRLTYMLARTPNIGELQRDGITVFKFSQQDLLQGHIYYLHSGGEIGPDPVTDIVTLIISDGESGTKDSCCHGDPPPPPVPLHGTLPVYDLNITILPVNNKVPIITLGENLLVVEEGSYVCLCGGVLGASDPDSHLEQLTFHLETPPLYGFIENTLPSDGSEKSNAGVPVESFSLSHLTSGFINYVQSEHKGVEPTVDQLSITVTDSVHNSAPVIFYIIINPTNDETPSLMFANFSVKEGGFRELTPSILDGFDLDAPPDVLTFTVERGPAHGSLSSSISGSDPNQQMGKELMQRRLHLSSFTLQELRQGIKLFYMHDDTETLEDTVVLRLTDGVHTVEGTAQVTVMPVNDNKPRLLKNVGLTLNFGELRVISSLILEVKDLDTPPDQVLFILNTVPRFGNLTLKGESGWVKLSAGQNFSQDDVEMNRLWYKHAAAVAAGFRGHDSFRFTLSDLDNVAPTQTFFISIHRVHKGEIALQSEPVHLMEGQRVVLNTDILLASDSVGRPDELVFTVLVPPQHGLVHVVQHPGVALTSFTQLDVAAHRVCYTHDNSHDGEADSFSFVVTNGDSSRSGALVFIIQRSDRIPPTLQRNSALRLQEGSTAAIDNQHLQLTDPDTAAANLSYTVTQLPRYGELLLKGTPLTSSPPCFYQKDVDELNLVYRPDSNSPAEIDRFHFLPGDGSNQGYLEFGQLREEPVAFNIQVERVDRTPPSLTIQQTPSSMVEVRDGRSGIFITSRHLQASDPGSSAEQLQFSISRPPRFGYLENAVTGAFIRARFTQRDVDRRALLFIVPADVEVTSDSFEFQLSDAAGNSASPQVLELSWSRVELSASCYRTCELAGTLQIQIQRSGRSFDPAYVAIQVEEGSAKPGRDFTHSSAALIQFDPGVNLKTWNIFLINDGLEENHETFTVFLKNPQNAVLGQRTSATVEIIDPSQGRCNPEDTEVDKDWRPPLPHLPDPTPAGKKEEEDPIIEVETEMLWEAELPPARGDVPDHHSLLDSEIEPQDEASPSYRTTPHHEDRQLGEGEASSSGHRLRQGGLKVLLPAQRRAEDRVWTIHSLTPLRLGGPQMGGAGRSWSLHSRLQQDQRATDAPLAAGPQLELHHNKTVSSSCPEGWTLYRGRCYTVSSSVASWASADRTCSLLFNSSLSSAASRRDMAWLWRFVGRRPFWMGSTEDPAQRNPADSQPSLRLTGALLGHSAGGVGPTCMLVQNPRSWVSTSCSADIQHRFICSSPAPSN
ncbi:FRAS1-related extracellular matrix protein 1 isoform X2 [Oryzias latipes]|uniref:FRAS1-related extracellular matrix protein 1 isoform X2 n=1 Tax=Oryzias latipes TaxID=8090 RepID=UPI0009DA520E|nr:FRAS1-related extracellular matrix protein 1 isoform X2 [Oryzias latipes]